MFNNLIVKAYPLSFFLTYTAYIYPIMDLSRRLVLLKSSAKEEEYPAFTPEDVIFLFEEIIQRV